MRIWSANWTHGALWTFLWRALQFPVCKMQRNHLYFCWWTGESTVFPHMSKVWGWERRNTQLESYRGTLPQMWQENARGSWNDNNGRLNFLRLWKKLYSFFCWFQQSAQMHRQQRQSQRHPPVPGLWSMNRRLTPFYPKSTRFFWLIINCWNTWR